MPPDVWRVQGRPCLGPAGREAYSLPSCSHGCVRLWVSTVLSVGGHGEGGPGEVVS